MISVVIITHNRECNILKRAIDSVLSQTYKDIEVIVVNDGNKSFGDYHNIVTMMKNYVSQCALQIRYIEHDAPKGACVARNTGLKIATGEYIAFLDDDDEWENNKLEKQLAVFENRRDNRVTFVYCGALFVYENDNEHTEVFHPKYLSGEIFDSLLGENFVLGASFPLIRTEYIRKVGGFDADFPSCQDWDMWLQLSLLGTVEYVEEPLVRYHIHQGDQITKNFRKRVDGLLCLLDKYMMYYKENEKAQYEILERLLYQFALNKNLGEVKNILKRISDLKGIKELTKIKLKLRVVKWLVLGGKEFEDN